MTQAAIALDVHVIGQRETGNEVYTLNLVRGLLAVAPGRRFALLTPHPERLPADVASHPQVWVVPVRPGNSFIRVPLSLPYTAWKIRAGLLHVNYNLPPVLSCPGVATVHDLSYELFPQDAPPRDRLVLGTLLPVSVRRAAAVIVVSESTKRDVIRRFKLPEERITVTYEAAPDHIHPVRDPEALAAVRARYGIRGPYVLAVGNLQPRKNLGRLVQAFAAIHQQRPDMQLVLTGQAKWRQSEVFRLVLEHGLSQWVIFTGYVPDDDLSPLYSGAAVFVYPSLYEGFGLPILEAMTCGAPTITSNISGPPEVAGDAALLVDPYSVPDLVAALERVLSDSDLTARLRARGAERARLFSWAETARRTMAVYDRVLDRSPRLP